MELVYSSAIVRVLRSSLLFILSHQSNNNLRVRRKTRMGRGKGRKARKGKGKDEG